MKELFSLGKVKEQGKILGKVQVCGFSFRQTASPFIRQSEGMGFLGKVTRPRNREEQEEYSKEKKEKKRKAEE